MLTRPSRLGAPGLALVLLLAAGCSGSGSGSSGSAGAAGPGVNGAAGGPSASAPANGSSSSGAAGSPGGGASLHLPLITPPVRAAAPMGLSGVMMAQAPGAPIVFTTTSLALDSTDIKQRFFSAGPTNIFQILGSIDARITETNMRSAQMAPCLSQPPVDYPLTPFGDSVTFEAQCYDDVGTDAFFQFGQQDGSTYFYSTGGAEHVAARVTPVGDAGDKYVVDAWIGVGYDNHAMGGSYGAIALHADSSTQHFEMAVAGIGFGYCGAQLASDGASVYAVGSTDMGSSCNDVATLCVSATDLSSTGSCDGLTTFTLPPMGRVASLGGAIAASQYPGGSANAITLDGTPTDSLAFGPATPTPGVGAFSAGAAPPPGGDGGAAPGDAGAP